MDILGGFEMGSSTLQKYLELPLPAAFIIVESCLTSTVYLIIVGFVLFDLVWFLWCWGWNLGPENAVLSTLRPDLALHFLIDSSETESPPCSPSCPQT